MQAYHPVLKKLVAGNPGDMVDGYRLVKFVPNPIQEKNMQEDDGTIRKFETGATRDTAVGKLDYEAGLSPLVLQRYMQYLDKHRKQSDGSTRDFDNWQKGMDQPVYMKSMLRHTIDTWLIHRGFSTRATNQDIEEALCAELFNTMGMLFEVLKNKETKA